MSKVRDKHEIGNVIDDINVAANVVASKLQRLPDSRAKSIAQTNFDTFMLWLAHAVKESSSILPDDIVADIREQMKEPRKDEEAKPVIDPTDYNDYNDTF